MLSTSLHLQCRLTKQTEKTLKIHFLQSVILCPGRSPPLAKMDMLGGSQPSEIKFLSWEGKLPLQAQAGPREVWLRPVHLAGSPGSQPKVRTPTHSGQIFILGQKPVIRNLPVFYSPAIAPDGKSGGSGGQNMNLAPAAVMHCAYHRTGGELASPPASPCVYHQFWVMQRHRHRAPPSQGVTVWFHQRNTEGREGEEYPCTESHPTEISRQEGTAM